jgi:hypothetical protein
MPRKPETDPLILAERRRRAREKTRLRVRKHRVKQNSIAASLLDHALAIPSPFIPPTETKGLAGRTADALLKRGLRKYRLTVDRSLERIDKAHDAVARKQIGDKETLQPLWQVQLRAVEDNLRLQERAGYLPGAKNAPAGTITVNVLMMPDDGSKIMRTLTTEKTDE